ncbi:hypothetical protein I4U23_001228 [Adineta vaga]|nr:hypothetical protein I4U23_001228 [Adineta vaga]
MVLYLKLLLTALARLPEQRNITVYRAVRCKHENEFEKYQIGTEFIWWGFSSCSTDRNICERETFIGTTGFRVLFIITCIHGVDIREHSYFRTENEVLLLPATKVRVTGVQPFNDQGLQIIFLQQLPTPEGLLEPVSLTNISNNETTLERKSSTFNNSESNYNPKWNEEFARYKIGTDVNLSRRRYRNDDFNTVITEFIINKKSLGIVLRESKLTADGARSLSKILMHDDNTLERLYLTENKIGDTGVEYIADALSHNKNNTLKCLCLASNDITDKGAIYLAKMLETNTTLTDLLLGRNAIRDEGFQRLLDVLISKNKTLQVLSIERNKCRSDENAISIFNLLENNKSLRKLNIIDCKLSRTNTREIRRLAAEKPNFELVLN